MKKILLSLMVALMALGTVITMSSCSPTAGLDELTLDQITAANMSGTYSCVVETKTYNSDGSVKTAEKSDSSEVSAAAVKTSMLTSAAAIGLSSTISSSVKGRVCANSKFTKIVIYAYTKDSSGHITAETITTYKKL
ncbi:MAG: hypothetical protein J5726_08375 [Treponema sp.]|nr:hypothetical protein [Treponema sp.]